ncbi:MAG: hypothetical protein LBL52_01700 [Rickettsiales bacterium]|nr:hypothetical protein [Rickettsiales bacterium]
MSLAEATACISVPVQADWELVRSQGDTQETFQLAAGVYRIDARRDVETCQYGYTPTSYVFVLAEPMYVSSANVCTNGAIRFYKSAPPATEVFAIHAYSTISTPGITAADLSYLENASRKFYKLK